MAKVMKAGQTLASSKMNVREAQLALKLKTKARSINPEKVQKIVTKRKLVDSTRRKNQQLLNALVNQATVGLAQTDPKGRFIFANKGYCDMVGRSAKELYQLTIHDVTHPDDVQRNRALFRKLLRSSHGFVIRKRNIRPDGSVVWLRSDISLIRDEYDRPLSVLVISINITESKEAASALRASEEKFRLATEAGKVGTWEWDIATDRVTRSDESLRLYGIEMDNGGDSLEGDLSLIHPDDKAEVASTIRKAVKKGSDFEVEFRIFRSDGKIRWIAERGRVYRDGYGKAIRVSGTSIDITERKNVVEALKESEARLRFMAESMPQKIFTAGPSGGIDYFNPQWMEYTGLPSQTIKKWGWNKFVHPNDLDEMNRHWQHSIDTGKPFQFEHRLRRADGQYRWHISRAHVMRDDKGNIVTWVGSLTDIDDIKRTTKRKRELEDITTALKQQRAELVALNRSKDEFISLASHQLRTPATGVKQFLGMVLEGYVGELNEGQKELLSFAQISNERQLVIVNDLLEVAQVDAGKVTLHKTTTNIVRLVQDVIDELMPKFVKRNQKISLKRRDPELLTEVDARRMRMVLENLIDNAGKYTPAGKNISVRVKGTKNGICIAIKDEGVGIAQKDLGKLFHKFTRLDNPLSISAGGSGLGLYWAQKIVDLHGGTITVDSELNKGSMFTVTVPG